VGVTTNTISDLTSTEALNVYNAALKLDTLIVGTEITSLIRYKVDNVLNDSSFAAVYQGKIYVWTGAFPKTIASANPTMEANFVYWSGNKSLKSETDNAVALANTGIANAATAQSTANTNASNISALTTRVTTAEGTIGTQGTRLTTAEGTITSQGTRLTTAEGNITTNTTNIGTNTTNISNLTTRTTAVENILTNGKFAYRGMYNSATGSTTGSSLVYTFAAESLWLADASYNMLGLRSVSLTVDASVSGAGGLDTGTVATTTWYYLWIIYNPTTAITKGLFSLSNTAPTLPSGYTYYARVGAIYTTTATAFRQITKRNNRVLYSTGVNVLTSGTATTATSISLAAAIPTDGSRCFFNIQQNNTGNYSSTLLGAAGGPIYAFCSSSATLIGAAAMWAEIVLSQTAYYYNSSASGSTTMTVWGYEGAI